jgi:hypothetical protein
MGINTQGVAYNFGQLGSAYTDLAAHVIIPPKDHVIVAIQNVGSTAATPSILTPEQLDNGGPNFVNIGIGDSNATYLTGAHTGNGNGAATVRLNNNAGGDINPVVMTTINTRVKPGQFVLLTNVDVEFDGSTTPTIDAQTPIPIYNGPNARGVKISKIDGANVHLEGHGNTAFAGLSPDTQMLICLDEQHGAGGMGGLGVKIPGGATIYGRYTAFAAADGDLIICYFGK